MADAPSPPAQRRSERALGLLLFSIACFVALGVVGTCITAAFLGDVPLAIAVGLAATLCCVFPLFLAVRAHLALRRRGYSMRFTRLVVLLLMAATQVAMFGAVLQFTDTTPAHGAALAARLLAHVPQTAGLATTLRDYARTEQVPVDEQQPAAPVDAGVQVADAVADAGMPVETPDAGPKALPATLSSRTAEGRIVRTFAVTALTDAGHPVVVVGTVGFGGRVAFRVVDFAALEKLGPITRAVASEDGTLAVVQSQSHFSIAWPDKTRPEQIAALSQDARINGNRIASVLDVAIADGGAVALVLERDAATGPLPILVHAQLQKKKAPVVQVLRSHGDAVPDSSRASIALAFALHARRGDGLVVVNERFRDGEDEIVPKLSGETYAMNPERLLRLSLKEPAKTPLRELARTDMEPSGLQQQSFQAFADAVALPDGRVVFDANFAERSATGWLFEWRKDAGAVAIAPKLMGEQRQALSTQAPRHRLLDVEPDGGLVLERGGDVWLTSLKTPEESLSGLRGAEVLWGNQVIADVLRVDVPMVTAGGEFVVALVRIQGRGASPGQRDAIVLSSRADLKNHLTEAVLLSGEPVPVTSAQEASFGQTLKSLRMPVREELLWNAL